METQEIENRVRLLKQEFSCGNPFGEKIMLVAATKTQSAEKINAAVRGGVDAIAENRAQEFRDKTGIDPCPRHFIGRLQTNKVKYLIGKIELLHSCDSDELAKEVAAQSLRKGIDTSILLQINAGEEPQKGGYAPSEVLAAIKRLSCLDGITIKGVTAVLPNIDDRALLKKLAVRVRSVFEEAKALSKDVSVLSMGMSGDYRLCLECGSNAVRLGTAIFGKRE